jgi:hypothetical protein
MPLLSTKIYTLYVNDSLETTLSRLREIIDKDRFMRIQTVHKKPFCGYLKEGKFKIQRITNYRNSFGPILEGQVTTQINGTNIKIEMYANSIALLFLYLWILVNIVMLFFVIMASILIPYAYVFVPLVLLVPIVGVFGFNYGYKKELKKSEDLILSILKPDKVEIQIKEDD